MSIFFFSHCSIINASVLVRSAARPRSYLLYFHTKVVKTNLGQRCAINCCYRKIIRAGLHKGDGYVSKLNVECNFFGSYPRSMFGNNTRKRNLLRYFH